MTKQETINYLKKVDEEWGEFNKQHKTLSKCIKNAINILEKNDSEKNIYYILYSI